jgi:glycosyltransferase involved in cell wall biosynthesis
VTSVAAVSAELPSSPGFQVRMMLPAPALRAAGLRVEPFTVGERRLALGARRALRRRLAASDHEVAWLYRRADLFPTLALESVAARGRRLVYDVDDAIWLDGRPETGTHPLARLKGSARKVRLLAERADQVVAANANLAEHLGRFSDAVTVIPSLVDTPAIPAREHSDSPSLVVGWIGSPWTAPFLSRLRAPLARAAAELRDVDLTLLTVGGSTAPIPGVRQEARAWSAAAQRDALERIDVGVMPLPDTAWNRGKSAYKALLYMAAGLPVVADDVGVAHEAVDGGGRLVRSERDWVEALVVLLRDRELRERLGRAGRERVERDYSLERWAPELARILRG